VDVHSGGFSFKSALSVCDIMIIEMPLVKEDEMDASNPQQRRITPRNPGNTIEPVRLRLEEGDFIGKVQDISIVGIGILTCQRLEPGTWFMLEPAEPNRGLRPELRAEVRHTTKLDEMYLVGCRFARFLTTEDVMALG
jgi:hypothetical protein